MLESNGTIDPETENWTSPEESSVVNKISVGLNWLARQNPSANVSFVLDVHYRVPTSYEPINHSTNDEGLWISEAMANLGYSGSYYLTQVRDYINSLRRNLDTDWAFSIFVVDSSNDPDGCFTNQIDPTRKWSAYAYLGGPFLVMTYDNDGYGIFHMDYVTAHETAHIFYATDEYNGVTETSGYLGVEDFEGSGDMMELALSWWFCTNSQEQLGWRDSDSDGVLDIVDTFPNTALNPFSPDPTNRSTLTYNGNAIEIPYKNNNPFGSHRNVTINKIVEVEFRVDSGTWQDASPNDGAFNESEEDFTFITSELSSGTHLVEARGENSAGNVEAPFAVDTTTVDIVSPITSVSYSSPMYIASTTTYVSKRTSFTLASFDDVSGVAGTYYRIDSSSWTSYSAASSFSQVSEGMHTLYFYSIDVLGNKETTRSVHITVDETEPDIFSVYPTNGTIVGSLDVSVSWSGSDNGSGIDHYETKIDMADYISKDTSTNHTFLEVTNGNHTVYIKAFDKLGNSKEFFANFLVDTSAPTVSITSPSSNTLTGSPSLTATWEGSDIFSGIDHYEVRQDDESWLNIGSSTMFSFSHLTDGQHELSVKAVDKAGNSAVAAVSLVVDATSPSVSITSPKNGNEIRSSDITVAWSGLDEASGMDHYEIRFDENEWLNAGKDTTYNFTQISDGIHMLYVKAVDKAGNFQEAHVAFSINTSLIGNPGWVDDATVFGGMSIAIVTITGVVLLRRRKEHRLP